MKFLSLMIAALTIASGLMACDTGCHGRVQHRRTQVFQHQVVNHRVVHLTSFAGQARYAFQGNDGMWVYLLMQNNTNPSPIVNNFYQTGVIPSGPSIAVTKAPVPPEEDEILEEEQVGVEEEVAAEEPTGENTESEGVGGPSGDPVGVPAVTEAAEEAAPSESAGESGGDSGGGGGDSGGGGGCGGGGSD